MFDILRNNKQSVVAMLMKTVMVRRNAPWQPARAAIIFSSQQDRTMISIFITYELK
jgi:hypothetical protein